MRRDLSSVAPDGWHHVYTAPEAIAALRAGGVVAVSLDHVETARKM